MGIAILPPDINRSGLKFTPEEEIGKTPNAERRTPNTELQSPEQAEMDSSSRSAIRYGLAAIKNVGESAMEFAIAERERGGEFKSLEDFCGRLGTRIANKKMLESLIKAGAFDFLGRDRAGLSPASTKRWRRRPQLIAIEPAGQVCSLSMNFPRRI